MPPVVKIQHGERHTTWREVDGLGYTGKALQHIPLTGRTDTVSTHTATIRRENASVEYRFFTFTDSHPAIHVFTLPIQPLNPMYSMRYAVSIDEACEDGRLQDLWQK